MFAWSDSAASNASTFAFSRTLSLSSAVSFAVCKASKSSLAFFKSARAASNCSLLLESADEVSSFSLDRLRNSSRYCPLSFAIFSSTPFEYSCALLRSTRSTSRLCSAFCSWPASDSRDDFPVSSSCSKSLTFCKASSSSFCVVACKLAWLTCSSSICFCACTSSCSLASCLACSFSRLRQDSSRVVRALSSSASKDMSLLRSAARPRSKAASASSSSSSWSCTSPRAARYPLRRSSARRST
mmetsp:Transcript_19365/g.37983  ORF Transcript_19365/g.37983 Transcript_19365/m.37983 type:complete len:242 (+) Transcript_19365:2669-3394(+)